MGENRNCQMLTEQITFIFSYFSKCTIFARPIRRAEVFVLTTCHGGSGPNQHLGVALATHIIQRVWAYGIPAYLNTRVIIAMIVALMIAIIVLMIAVV